jgi:hypothetical protein
VKLLSWAISLKSIVYYTEMYFCCTFTQCSQDSHALGVAHTMRLAAHTMRLAAHTMRLAAHTIGLAAHTIGLAAHTIGLAALQVEGLVLELLVMAHLRIADEFPRFKCKLKNRK